MVLAVLSIILGVVVGGMWVWISVASLYGTGNDLWTLLFALPFVCFGAIALIIGIKYLIHQDTEHAKGVAAMTGFLVWALLNGKVSERGSVRISDDPNFFWLYFLGPIILGVLVYRILFWGIRKRLGQEQNYSGEGTT